MSLVGLPALQALLYHCQYFQHVAVSATCCYRGRYTYHLQRHSVTTKRPGSQESGSLGKLCFVLMSACETEAMALFFQCKFMRHCARLDSENSLWFWRCDPPAPTANSSRPSSSLSTSSTVVSDALFLQKKAHAFTCWKSIPAFESSCLYVVVYR